MKMLAVDSSNVRSVGYDDKTSTLQIEFKNGSFYQYFDVPKQIYDGLLAAESVGKYMHQNVKGIYRYSRV